MRLIGLAVVVAASLALAPLAGEAQQAVKVPRVGFLIAGSSQGIQPYLVCLPAAFCPPRHTLLPKFPSLGLQLRDVSLQTVVGWKPDRGLHT